MYIHVFLSCVDLPGENFITTSAVGGVTERIELHQFPQPALWLLVVGLHVSETFSGGTSASYSRRMVIQAHSAAADKVATKVGEFEMYTRNNCKFIPNFGERRRHGETINTALVESTTNQVVSRRFVKKQQMEWTLRGSCLLLQPRTKVLNSELDGAFRNWYPLFRADAA
jgi:hypothetical protein